MTQSPEERRLRRVAAAYNRDARMLGQYHRVDWLELAYVQSSMQYCNYCGVGLEQGQGTFDHMIPLDRGGPNQGYNLVRCCYACQREKGTKTPEEYTSYKLLIVSCATCGKDFKPRWGEWKAGRGRFCSRSCAAKSRWVS